MEMTIDHLHLEELNVTESAEISGGLPPLVVAIAVSLVGRAIFEFSGGVAEGIRQSAP